MHPALLPASLALLLAVTACHAVAAAPRACAANATPQLLDAQFTSALQGNRPTDQPAWLAPGQRDLHAWAQTRGEGRIGWRWFINGRSVAVAHAGVGNGAWHGWSRLRTGNTRATEIRVQLLGANDCLLREMTILANDLALHPDLQRARAELAAGDATGARLTLKLLLEDGAAAPALRREAKRLLDTDIEVGRAGERLHAGELFLVEGTLAQVERRLGRTAADDVTRRAISRVRRELADTQAALARDGIFTVAGVRALLAGERLLRGDYPLARTDLEKLLAPALAHAGGHYRVTDWQPLLRGYRLLLQDTRTGTTWEVTP